MMIRRLTEHPDAQIITEHVIDALGLILGTILFIAIWVVLP